MIDGDRLSDAGDAGVTDADLNEVDVEDFPQEVLSQGGKIK